MLDAPNRIGAGAERSALKVVHVVRQFTPAVGGLEEAVLKLCLALRHKGVNASVVTLDRIAKGSGEPLPHVAMVAGIPVQRIPFRGSWRYPVAPSVLRKIADADVVHVHAIDFFFDYLALTRPIHRKPMVASTHGGFFHTPFAQRLKRFYFQSVTRASSSSYDVLCASSPSDLAMFAPIASRNLVLVENGVDVDKWRGLAPEVRNRAMLYIGRLSSNKQLEKLVDLLAHLRALDPDWTLTIAGRSWDVSGAMLMGRASGLGVADHVRVIEDPTDATIAIEVARASYAISASRHEGFGIGVVEGLSAGQIPLLNAIPPFLRLIEQAKCGCVFDADRLAEAAASIKAVHDGSFDDPTLRDASMAVAARYGWDEAADLFVGHYGRAIDAGPAGRALPGRKS